MRDHAAVSRRQLRTSNYTPEDRARLGKAVEDARIAAGYKYRTDFCRAHNIKNLRGLELLEQGKTGVGQAFLFEVADALPAWDRETPRLILEGSPPPPLGAAPPSADPDAVPPDWTDEEEQLWKVARHVLPGLLGMPPTKPLTRQRFRWVKDEVEKLIAAERAAGVVTPSDYS